MDLQEIISRIDLLFKNMDLMSEEELNSKTNDIRNQLDILESKNVSEKLNIEDMQRALKELCDVVMIKNRIKERIRSMEKPIVYSKHIPKE